MWRNVTMKYTCFDIEIAVGYKDAPFKKEKEGKDESVD